MSTATLPREARRNVVSFFAAGKEAKEVSEDPTSGFSKSWTNENGHRVLKISNMPVFRSGTFRDSYGIQHTWDDIHMENMVQHFDLLRQRALLEHLPVRKGHPGFLTTPAQATDEVIGYHTGLRTGRMTNPVDGKEYNYLFADYDIIDPEAAEKVDRGQWRNMSAEVGHWFTNDEAEYWPVYQGVAYCDFSAVEGLRNFSSANGVGSTFSIMTDKEQTVAGEPNGQTVTVPTPPAGVPTPPVPPVTPAAPAQQVFEFTLAGGRKVSDFAAVQAHIADLESKTAQYEATEKERREGTVKAFVKSLSEGPTARLTEAQIKPTEEFALSLNDAQFAVWRSQWEAIPASPVFAGQQMGGGTQFQAGQQTPPQGGGQPGQAAAQTELDTAKAVVANFQRTGMKADQIKETPSFKKLEAAGQAPQL